MKKDENRERLLRYYDNLSESGRAQVRMYADCLLEVEESEKKIEDRRVRASKKMDGEKYCDFCGKLHSEVPSLIVGPMFNICSDCIAKCNEALSED